MRTNMAKLSNKGRLVFQNKKQQKTEKKACNIQQCCVCLQGA